MITKIYRNFIVVLSLYIAIPVIVANVYGYGETVVGDYEDKEKLVFEGIQTFTVEQIRSGLMEDSDFVLAAHYKNQLSEYLKTVQEKVQLGYKNNGFPDALVAVSLDKNAKKIIVKVIEGPRYYCGDVRITGTKHISAKKMVERLTYVQSLMEREKAKLETFDVPMGVSELLSKTIWKKGEPASFAETEIKFLRDKIKTVLSEFGYFSPNFEVSVVPKQGKSTALLQIKIQNEGPNARIGEIIITGNKRNSREDILKYLNLKVGMKFSQKNIDQINELLWNSARFLDYKVTTDSNSPKLILKIYAPELEHAPLLSEDFSPTEKTMLKLRKYMIGSPNRNDDFVFSLQSPKLDDNWLKIIFSLNKGIIVEDEKIKSVSPETIDSALVMSLEKIGLYSPYRQKKLILPKPPGNIITLFHILPNSNPEGKKPFFIQFGIGADSKESFCPVNVDFRLAPSFFVYLAHKTYSTDGNVATITDENSCIKMDINSGRLIELTKNIGTVSLTITIENGAFDRTIREVNESMAESANCFDSQRPTTSTVGYLLEEPTLQKLFRKNYMEEVSPEKFARSMKVLNILVNKNIMGSVDEKVIAKFKNFTDPNKFSLPMEYDNTEKLVGMVFSIIFKASDEIFPKMSWPWTIAHESVFVAENKGKYTMEELQRIYESEDMGPIGFWAAAKLLTYVNPQLAPAFADKGIEKLSVGDFRKDYQLLFQSPMLNEVVRNAVAALRDLRDDEVEALTDIMSPQTRGYIQIARENKSKLANEILSMALDEYWEKELKERVQKGFAAIYFKLGVAYDKLSRYDAAIEAFEKSIRLDPNLSYSGYSVLGYMYRELGRYNDAREVYEKAISIRPDSAECYYGLGYSYAGLSLYDKAVEAQKQALKFDPNYTDAYIELGVDYSNLGRYNEEIEAYKKVLDINPEHAMAYNNLGEQSIATSVATPRQ